MASKTPTKAVSARVRAELALAYPALAGRPAQLDLQLESICMRAYLLADPSEDEMVSAIQAWTWSWKRIKELECKSDDLQARLERECLLSFVGDRRASSLLFKSKLGERLGIADAAYLNRMRKRRALYGINRHPMESARPATDKELAECERQIRIFCKVPDDLPDDRLIQVIEDYESIAFDSYQLTDEEEHRSSAMSATEVARKKAVRRIKADLHAVDLYSRRLLGEPLTDYENAYLDAELLRESQ